MYLLFIYLYHVLRGLILTKYGTGASIPKHSVDQFACHQSVIIYSHVMVEWHGTPIFPLAKVVLRVPWRNV